MIVPKPQSIRQLNAVTWIFSQEQPTSVRQLNAVTWIFSQEKVELAA